MHADPNFRLLTLGVVGALAAFVWLYIPRSAYRRLHDVENEMLSMQALEVTVEEEGRTRKLRLPLPVLIGRAADATLVIQDAQVSRMHARIDQVEGTLFLHDLGSRNGTLVNARPIESPVPLRENDEIDIGAARVVVGKIFPWK